MYSISCRSECTAECSSYLPFRENDTVWPCVYDYPCNKLRCLTASFHSSIEVVLPSSKLPASCFCDVVTANPSA